MTYEELKVLKLAVETVVASDDIDPEVKAQWIGNHTTQEKLMDMFEYKEFAINDDLRRFVESIDEECYIGRSASSPIYGEKDLVGYAFTVYPPRYPKAIYVDFTKPKAR
ncbi:MAG: hypothetical protein LBQ21_07555 [Clostridiales Family XIII bacterium]|jgi:hypothetical protein|nr:hypothetical protein [Clostridiales Family XIII bacterium]